MVEFLGNGVEEVFCVLDQLSVCGSKHDIIVLKKLHFMSFCIGKVGQSKEAKKVESDAKMVCDL